VSLTATLNGAPFASGSAVTADGNYTLAVSALDRAGNRASVTVDFIRRSIAAELSARLGGRPRVLVGVECAGGHGHPDFLLATLRNAGYAVDLVQGRDGWLAALRTDVYGELVLYLPSDQDDGALEEASASVD